MHRLPERYRQAVVLCYLAGKTTAEAAQCLGCPRGTILSRLAWARRRLQARLTKRGVAPAAGGVAVLLAASASSAALPVELVGTTVRAAAWFAAGSSGAAGVVSARAVHLMERGLHAMFLTKLKVAVAIGAALLIGLGFGLLAYRPAAADPIRPPRDAAPAAEEKKREVAPAAPGGDAPERKVASKPAEVERPVGTWERKVGTFQIVLRIEADHVTGTFSGRNPEGKGEMVNVTVDADYSVTRDHVLYGVITGIDMDNPLEDGKEMAGLLSDYAFSVHYRVDGDVLTIKDFKFGSPEDSKNSQKETAMFMGRYKKKDGRDRDTGGRR